MVPISVTAEAGLDIIRRLASGELEVHGILLRDSADKKFRYILRGFEDLPRDAARLSDLPPLEPLRAAVDVTQQLQVVSIAQNAAVAATLRRIGIRLEAIEERLSDLQARLTRMQTAQALTLDALRSQPVARLKAAKAAAVVALRHGDRTALIVSGQDAQQAFHDLLEQARHLVRTEERGVPVPLRMPLELADLSESAADAAYVASAIWISVGSQGSAAAVTRDCAQALRSMRQRLADVLTDPEFLLRRMKADEGRDHEVVAAGQRMEAAMHGSLGRTLIIEQGLMSPDPKRTVLERIQPVSLLAFEPVAATISS